MSNRYKARNYWLNVGDFCGTIPDDHFAEEVTPKLRQFVFETPGVDLDVKDSEWDGEMQQACAGVTEAFLVYLAKLYDTEWIVWQLTRYLKEQKNERPRVGGDAGSEGPGG